MAQCVGIGTGIGTGINAEQLAKKIELVSRGVERVKDKSPLNVLAELGGFEIAQICEAMLATAQAQKLILVDGFIVSIAALLATHFNSNARDHMIFAHKSEETGHQLLLQLLHASALASGYNVTGLALFWESPTTAQPPQGERLQDFAQRVVDAWQRLMSSVGHQEHADTTHQVIVCHGGVIRIIIAHLLKLDFCNASLFQQLHIDYASQSRIEIANHVQAVPVIQYIGLVSQTQL